MKNYCKVGIITLAVIIGLSLAGCDNGTTPVSAAVAVTGVTLNQTSITTLGPGDIVILVPTVMPNNAANKAVTWDSDNTGVATVDANGKVTAVTAGNATITVTTADGGKTATCAVTVSTGNVPVTGVTLDESALDLYVGYSKTLDATIIPGNATNQNVIWSSDKPNIAAVDQDGVVKGIAVGTAIITVTTSNGGETAACTVTVKAIPAEAKRLTITGLNEYNGNGLWFGILTDYETWPCIADGWGDSIENGSLTTIIWTPDQAEGIWTAGGECWVHLDIWEEGASEAIKYSSKKSFNFSGAHIIIDLADFWQTYPIIIPEDAKTLTITGIPEEYEGKQFWFAVLDPLEPWNVIAMGGGERNENGTLTSVIWKEWEEGMFVDTAWTEGGEHWLELHIWTPDQDWDKVGYTYTGGGDFDWNDINDYKFNFDEKNITVDFDQFGLRFDPGLLPDSGHQLTITNIPSLDGKRAEVVIHGESPGDWSNPLATSWECWSWGPITDGTLTAYLGSLYWDNINEVVKWGPWFENGNYWISLRIDDTLYWFTSGQELSQGLNDVPKYSLSGETSTINFSQFKEVPHDTFEITITGLNEHNGKRVGINIHERETNLYCTSNETQITNGSLTVTISVPQIDTDQFTIYLVIVLTGGYKDYVSDLTLDGSDTYTFNFDGDFEEWP